MKDSTRNRAEGKFHEVKGKGTAKAGKVTGNPKLEADGQDEKVAGEVQQVIGKVEKALGE